VRRTGAMPVLRAASGTEYYLKRIGRFSFFEPLPVTATFSNGKYLLVNEDLVISGEGETFVEALKDLEDSIDSLVVGFQTFPEEMLSESSLKIKRELEKYFKIDTR